MSALAAKLLFTLALHPFALAQSAPRVGHEDRVVDSRPNSRAPAQFDEFAPLLLVDVDASERGAASSLVEQANRGRPRLVLPDGRAIPARVDRIERRDAGTTISGEMMTKAPGTFVFVREGSECVGWLSVPGEGEYVRTKTARGWTSDGPTPFRPVDCRSADVLAQRSARADVLAPSPIGPATTSAITQPMTSATPSLEPCHCDDGGVIDVLALFTPAAASHPTSAGAGVSIQTFIQLTVDVANQAFAASGVQTRLRLLAPREIAYSEAGVGAYIEHLERLGDPSDGFLDAAHAWRDRAAADLVTLFVDSPGDGGVAWGAFGPASGFSVNSTTSSIPTLTHEIGHNLGCNHDPATVQTTTGHDPRTLELSYNYGHKFVAQGTTYGCVMSYLAAGEVGLVRFSNPGLSYLGVPTGVAPGAFQPASNALAIEHFRRSVASYRDDGFSDCNGNSIDDAVDIQSATSIDANLNSIPDECEQRLYVDSNSAGGDGRSWNTAWPDLKDALYSSSQKCGATTEVWVARGTYRPDRGTTERAMSFQFGDGLAALYGGFIGTETALGQRNWVSHVCVLSGDLAGNDTPGFANHGENSLHVLHAPVGLEPGAIVDGFSIRGGNADAGGPDAAGGGMRVRRGAPTVRNCSFSGNRAGYGGAIHLEDCPSTSAIESCSFQDNEALYEGGALQTNHAGVRVSDCSFDVNRGAAGGAAFLYASRGELSRTQFANNVAVAYDGGALLLHSSQVRLEACTLRANTARKGGGCAAFRSVYEVLDAQFVDNHAGVEGGGLWSAESEGAITDSSFSRNDSAWAGGGLFIWQSNPQIERCRFDANLARVEGGAVWGHLSSERLVNSVLSGNRAGVQGGALFHWQSAFPSLVNCTVVDSAPNALVDVLSSTSVANSIVWNCGAVPIPGSATSVTYSDVQFGHAGAGNIALDPKLVSQLGLDGVPGTGDEDTRLAKSSPCIDAASNAAMLGSGARDVRSDYARRPRFENDPLAQDTGVGARPLVDMGANERRP